ncbi:adenosine deaminase [Kistimonas asteriae]|uniref:adenosine deaminase n=1 Tax=Kistimonas asteriae TaxID=517724 RepID=UPI001BAA4565|nr:adenosine deaminase [Kistimonas asteriae]
MHEFIAGLPKAELHVHLEGTLEPEHCLALAQRNGIPLEHKTPEALIRSYDFCDLPSFLKVYYSGIRVLVTELDFFELAFRYFQRAASDGVVYVEAFFDPQAHTVRGIPFEVMMNGIHRAQCEARAVLGLESNLILCFLRDQSAESAAEHLAMSVPFREWIVGVGLDSDEKNNPPSKFVTVFADAHAQGYKLTMHCDVNQMNTLDHIRECLDLIKVDRIDHGLNCLEDEQLCNALVERGIGLTICPVSNRFVVQSLTSDAIRTMLRKGIKVTVNSDDPAYFRAYINENLMALIDEAGFTKEEIKQLMTNAFEIAWLPDARKARYLQQLEQYAAKYAITDFC